MKLTWFLLAISILILSTTGCEKVIEETTEQIPSSVQQDPDGFVHEYGITHNEALGYIHNRYTHSPQHFQASIEYEGQRYLRKKYVDSTLIFLQEYMVLSGITVLEAQTIANAASQLFNEANMFITIDNELYFKDISNEISNLNTAALALGLTNQTELSSVANITNAVIAKDYQTAKSLIESLDLTLFDITNTLSPFMVKSVFEYSTEYWEEWAEERQGISTPFPFVGINTIIIDAIASCYGGPAVGALFSALYLASQWAIGDGCICPVCRYYDDC